MGHSSGLTCLEHKDNMLFSGAYDCTAIQVETAHAATADSLMKFVWIELLDVNANTIVEIEQMHRTNGKMSTD